MPSPRCRLLLFLYGSGQQRYIRPCLGVPAPEGRNCLPTEYSPRYACVRWLAALSAIMDWNIALNSRALSSDMGQV